MDGYLLTMFDRHPRRFHVIENIVRNKRTQANLFWGLNYGILNWLGSDVHLTDQEFIQWLGVQQQHGLLDVEENEAQLTEQGEAVKQQIMAHYYHPQFDQWAWLTNTRRFAERFMLAVQAISELSYQNRHYIPLNISVTEMAVVRNWLTRPNIITQVHQELIQLGTQLNRVDSRLAVLFANQLFGHNGAGWTLEQAAGHFQLHLEEVQLMNRDVWLGIASILATWKQSALGGLMNDLIARTPISSSAYKTLTDFQHGYLPEQIAKARRLKLSTVREHLLEAAIIIPDGIDWQRLLSKQEEKQIHRQYSGPVEQWQFQRPAEDVLQAFFKFRLCQIKELHFNHG